MSEPQKSRRGAWSWRYGTTAISEIRAQNNHFQIFLSSTTNIEFTMTVTDSTSGQTRSYTNSLGETSPSILDTEAFATCP